MANNREIEQKRDLAVQQLIDAQRGELLNLPTLKGDAATECENRIRFYSTQIAVIKRMDTSDSKEFIYMPVETLQTAMDKVMDFFNEIKNANH